MAINPKTALAKEIYYYGQGKVSIAEIKSDGTLGNWVFLWDVSQLNTSADVTNLDHKEAWSGEMSTARSFIIGSEITINMTLFNFNPHNLAIGMRGENVIKEAGTVTAFELPIVEEGDTIFLDDMGISDLELTDQSSAALGEEFYTLNPASGEIVFKSLPTPALTQPFKAAYSHGATITTGLLNAKGKNYALRYDGVNLAENSAPCAAMFYKMSAGMAEQIALITSGDALASMNIAGKVLRDSSKPSDAKYGNFGYYRQLAA